MKILAIAAALIVAASPVYASDVLVAVMDNGRGGKEIHYQTAKGNGCEQLITRLKQLRSDGRTLIGERDNA
jgi:hypothetical protein